MIYVTVLIICFQMFYANLPFHFQSWNIKLALFWGNWCIFFLFKCTYVSVHWQVFLFHNISTSFIQNNVPSSPLSKDRDLFTVTFHWLVLITFCNYSHESLRSRFLQRLVQQTLPGQQKASVCLCFLISSTEQASRGRGNISCTNSSL